MGKWAAGTVRHACFIAAARRLNICYSCADVDFPLLSESIVTVFTFRGGDNGKIGGGTVRHACFATAARCLNICYSCTDVDFPLLSEPIVTSGLGLMRKGKDLRLISY